MTQDLLHAVNAAARPHIAVVGDLILDLYVRGDVSRVSPEAPIPVLAVKHQEYKLGGAANVAANIVSMGGTVTLVGALADDEAGKMLRSLARATKSLTLSPVVVNDRPTIVKTRMVAQHQQMLRVDEERAGELAAISYRDLRAALESALKDGADLLILSDYGKGVLSERFTREAVALARKAKVPVLVDPKGRDYAKYAGATAITPNRAEAEAATGVLCDGDAGAARAAKWLLDKLKLDAAVITLGAGGVALLERGGHAKTKKSAAGGKSGGLVRIPTVARSVFDVTGAGDTFIATLGAFMAQGLEIAGAARLANIAAGIKVGKFGAAAITRDELRRALIAAHEAFDYHAKIVSRDDLKSIAETLRKDARRIVFTNGCFDILHAGHVTYLHFCKSRGDVLVLGLNSDASVRAIKGKDRPVNSEADRARVLAALADVDFISVFSEHTPDKLIRAVAPDVLIKGADWEGKIVVGADFVESYGGEVVFAPLLKGRSTSAVIDKMRKR